MDMQLVFKPRYGGEAMGGLFSRLREVRLRKRRFAPQGHEVAGRASEEILHWRNVLKIELKSVKDEY